MLNWQDDDGAKFSAVRSNVRISAGYMEGSCRSLEDH